MSTLLRHKTFTLTAYAHTYCLNKNKLTGSAVGSNMNDTIKRK